MNCIIYFMEYYMVVEKIKDYFYIIQTISAVTHCRIY